VPKTVLMTGISGQDGSYLAEAKLAKGDRIVAYMRPGSRGLGCSTHLIGQLTVRSFPIDSSSHWKRLLEDEQPDEVYHLGASTFVPDSWNDPIACHDANVEWSIRLLDAVREVAPSTRVLMASSSEVFGRPRETPQNEETAVCPVTPYGVTKAAMLWMTRAYRERYGLFIANAILYNHESPRRPSHFVTRKISHAVASIVAGRQQKLVLGSLDIDRDWGYAVDYVEAMQQTLKLDSPEDFVIGSGRLESLRRVVEVAFESVGLNYRDFVETDPRFVRPTEPISLRAEPAKAKRLLNWEAKTSMPEVIRMMVAHDLHDLQSSAKAA
jgi:GDPmannose 4,6-dehydratase